MKNWMNLILTLLVGISFISCGSDDPAQVFNDAKEELNEENTENKQIQKKWRSDCKESELLHASVVRSFDFSGEEFTERYIVFSDAACEDAEGEVNMTGTFDINDLQNEEVDDDLQTIELRYTTMAGRADSEIGTVILDAVDFCGVEDWSVGEEKVISDAGVKNCFLTKTPVSKFGRIKVDESEDKLYISKEFVEDPETLPKSIDPEMVFHKVD